MKLVVKEVPQDSVWLDPQTECLVRVNREPNHPGGCPEWVQWTKCNPRNESFVQRCLTIIVGKVLCWLRLWEFFLFHWVLILVWIMFVLLHLYLLVMCILRNGELGPLVNLKVFATTWGLLWW